MRRRSWKKMERRRGGEIGSVAAVGNAKIAD